MILKYTTIDENVKPVIKPEPKLY